MPRWRCFTSRDRHSCNFIRRVPCRSALMTLLDDAEGSHVVAFRSPSQLPAVDDRAGFPVHPCDLGLQGAACAHIAETAAEEDADRPVDGRRSGGGPEKECAVFTMFRLLTICHQGVPGHIGQDHDSTSL